MPGRSSSIVNIDVGRPEIFQCMQDSRAARDRYASQAAGGMEQTFYRWKKVHGGVLPGEARELKQLREENSKLKRIVADLTLDKVMLQDIVQKSSKARQAA